LISRRRVISPHGFSSRRRNLLPRKGIFYIKKLTP
jgi:hypothetical protein